MPVVYLGGMERRLRLGKSEDQQSGGLIGALVGMGIPEYEAKRYEGRIKEGGVLLSAHCNTSEQITIAKDILKETGAEDISSTGEASADTKATANTSRV